MKRQNRSPSSSDTATTLRMSRHASWLRSAWRRPRLTSSCGRNAYSRSGTWQANALSEPTALRSPHSRAASPAYSSGRGLTGWTTSIRWRRISPTSFATLSGRSPGASGMNSIGIERSSSRSASSLDSSLSEQKIGR